MAEQRGTLHFNLGFRSQEMKSIPFPVRVKRPNLTVAAESVSSESVELEPGTYYVTARMPAGQELFGSATIQPGCDEWVTLTPEPGEEPLSELEEALHFLVGQATTLYTHSSAYLFLRDTTRRIIESLLDLTGISELLTPGALKTATGKVKGRLRAFSGNLLRNECQVTTHLEFNERKVADAIRLDPLNTQGALLIQLLQPKAPALNVAFPCVGEGTCSLLISKLPNDMLSMDMRLGHPSADLLTHYLESGLLQSAAITTTSPTLDAEILLRMKRDDQVAAAVGAYTLLRLGDLERLHDWTANLSDWFPWLPDGLVIRGEHLARLGRHEEAFRQFIELPARGLPFFSDGLSYTVDRLRLYLKAGLPASCRNKSEDVEGLLNRLEDICNYVDFSKLILSFTGLDPLHPGDGELTEELSSYSGFDLETAL
jgi:hypothetical protein